MSAAIYCDKNCGAEVHAWRTCGAKTCPKTIAYCDTHGGDKRAMEEMAQHITTAHVSHDDASVTVLPEPQPEKVKPSFAKMAYNWDHNFWTGLKK